MSEAIQIRIHGDASLPTLIYLPGLHGDWTLVSSFRAAIAGQVRFVEFTYPRTVTWSLDDYARAIEEALLAKGIERGWLLGESFGSQPAWQIIQRERAGARPSPPAAGATGNVAREDTLVPQASSGFHPLGLILAGGFVRHPVIWAVRMTRRVSSAIPLWCVGLFCIGYAQYARFRHKRTPETLATIAEFVANRTIEADRQAIVHRNRLIADNDLRQAARQFDRPVYYLAGLVDPLVPWLYVRWWLRKNCPGYRSGKTMWRADHNVLGTAPKASAELVVQWLNAVTAVTEEPKQLPGIVESQCE